MLGAAATIGVQLIVFLETLFCCVGTTDYFFPTPAERWCVLDRLIENPRQNREQDELVAEEITAAVGQCGCVDLASRGDLGCLLPVHKPGGLLLIQVTHPSPSVLA